MSDEYFTLFDTNGVSLEARSETHQILYDFIHRNRALSTVPAARFSEMQLSK